MTSRSETKNQSAIDYLDFPEAIRIDARPWDRPYRVDSSRFAKRFWGDTTPFEVGAPATALWFRDRAAR